MRKTVPITSHDSGRLGRRLSPLPRKPIHAMRAPM